MRDLLSDESFLRRRHLLAFSGGPDSVYLLERLAALYQEDLPRHVELAYVDYHDSPFVEEEERIVLHYQRRYGLSLHRKDVRYVEEKGNFEDWARRERYRFFAEICSRLFLDDVLTAHHQDDAIETYLLQKERNNLPRRYGLAEESRIFGVLVVRPLLFVTKEAIYRFLKERSLPFYEDCTNHDDHTRRNGLRRPWTPQERERFEREIDFRNGEVDRLSSQFATLSKTIPFSFYDSLTEEGRKRLLFFLLQKEEKLSVEKREAKAREAHEFLKRHENGVLKIDQKNIYRTKNSFFFSYPLTSNEYELDVTGPGVYQTPLFRLEVHRPEEFRLSSFPFVVRNARKGDQMESGLLTKDVSLFLRRQKVPFYYREGYPVFLKEGKILFVPFYSDVRDGKVPLTFLWP